MTAEIDKKPLSDRPGCCPAKQLLKAIATRLLTAMFIRRRTGGFNKEGIHNILIIRNEYLGDMLTFIPALMGLRNHFSDAKFYIMVSPTGKEVLERSLLADEFILADREKFSRMGIFEFIRLIRYLRKAKFDLAISSPNTLFKPQLCAFLSGAPYRIGYNNINSGYLFNLPISFDPDNNEVRECFKILEILGIKKESIKYPDLWPKDAERDSVASLFRESGITESDFVVGINVGSKQPANWWLPERWSELIGHLSKNYSARIVLIGGKENRSFADAVIREAKFSLLDAVARLNVKQLALVVKRCNLMVSHDSGVAHMAALMGIPTVVLFGKSSYNKWGYPDNPRYRAVYKDICCRLCGKIKCDDNICMKLIKVEDVVGAVHGLIG